MNKIILIVGDSGQGKDFIMEVANKYENIDIIKRYISRSRIEKEQDSISSNFNIDIEEIKKMDYFYEGAEKGNWYAIKKSDLEKSLISGFSPMVVCPNYNNFRQIEQDFPGLVVNYFIYRGYDDTELDSWRKSLIDRGSSLDEIEKREKTRDKYFRELYIEHTNDYNENVILNIYGLTTEDDIKMQLEGLALKNDIDMGSFKQLNKSK